MAEDGAHAGIEVEDGEAGVEDEDAGAAEGEEGVAQGRWARRAAQEGGRVGQGVVHRAGAARRRLGKEAVEAFDEVVGPIADFLLFGAIVLSNPIEVR